MKTGLVLRSVWSITPQSSGACRRCFSSLVRTNVLPHSEPKRLTVVHREAMVATILQHRVSLGFESQDTFKSSVRFISARSNNLPLDKRKLNQPGGHIDVIMGPMFSGKTTEMFRRINRYQIAGRKCLTIKYKKDTRYSENMASTHDRKMITALPCHTLSEAEVQAEEYDVIGIDDGHFFQDLSSFCNKFADKGKTIVVAALDGTYQREGFEPVMKLIPLADQVVKLTAVCVFCKTDAPFTIRTVPDKEVELIGGADKYVAVCRSCFTEKSE